MKRLRGRWVVARGREVCGIGSQGEFQFKARGSGDGIPKDRWDNRTDIVGICELLRRQLRSCRSKGV